MILSLKQFMKNTFFHCLENTVDECNFKILNPEEISEIDAPPFDTGKYASEEKYKDFLESMQPYFDEYEKSHSLPERYKEIFLGVYRVKAIKKKDGQYRPGSGGRHRMFIARKYGFRLLVEVSGESDENDKPMIKLPIT